MLRVPSLHNTEEGKQSKSLGNFISPSHDAQLRAEHLLGVVPGNTRLASCKKRQVPGWGIGSVQRTGEIAPQVAGVAGNCSGTKRHDEVRGCGQKRSGLRLICEMD